MLLSLLSRSKKPEIRCVNVYASSQCFIIAAMHQNFAGIYYEQSEPVLIQGKPSAEELGSTFRNAFDEFSIKDVNLRETKRSDWPSFKASYLRTPKEFERSFRLIHCASCDASNAVVRASVTNPTHSDIELSASFNPLSAPKDIGASLLLLLEVAQAI